MRSTVLMIIQRYVFIDLRYRAKDRYPFVAVVTMDKFYNIITSYTGWVYSEDKLQKKIRAFNLRKALN